MCGIAGWLDLKNDLTREYHIMDAMSATLASRGPDSSGTWFSSHMLLAHRRLAVMDPAGGAQPMVRQKGGYNYAIVYNGELYNAPELKKSLEGYGFAFSTTCDTEVLLLSYIQWGPDCIERLNVPCPGPFWSKTTVLYAAWLRPYFRIRNQSITCPSPYKAGNRLGRLV